MPKLVRKVRLTRFAIVLVVWNGLLLFAIWLNGGWRSLHETASLAVVAVACYFLGTVAVMATLNRSPYDWLMRPGAKVEEVRGELAILAVVAFVMGSAATLAVVVSIL